jgi:SNF2 family DNA or RNA helicase
MNSPRKTIIVSAGPVGTGKAGNAFETGILLNFNQERKGGMAVELLMVTSRRDERSFQRIPLAGTNYVPYLSRLPVPVATVLKKLTDEALVDLLVKKGYGWLRDAGKPFDHLSEHHHLVLRHYICETLQELKPLAPAIRHLFYLPAGEVFHSSVIKPAAISAFNPALQFVLEKGRGGEKKGSPAMAGNWLHLRCLVTLQGGVFPLGDFQRVPYFLKSRNEYFLLKKEDGEVLDRIHSGDYECREEGLPRFMATVVKPLGELYPVDVSGVIGAETVDVAPEGRVHLSELNENFLLIKPKWVYSDHEVEDGVEAETKIEREDTVFVILRKKDEERKLMDALRGLHPKFETQRNGYFYLNFREALEKSWFLRFYQQMQKMDIPVLGMNKLRKFKYNTNIPVFEIVAGRSIDWFDLEIRVSYGDLVVPLQELRKAILGRQDYILLADGSLGILPKEWLDKYTMLLKMGQLREGGIQLPAVHWTLLDESAKAVSGDDSLQTELAERRQRLKEVTAGKTWPVPAGVQAHLRDYQQGGFQWMCLLDEMGWGGCLADDMGLGKTLQTLCFLQHIVTRYPEETHLVVCPTSLLYNWEAELKKFVPGMDYHIHYGVDRELDDRVFRRGRLIITSYGMVRSDSEHFSRFRFGYVVLDESQAIKNPASQVRKAVQQLQSRNRLALSGTPVQNNTFDLYAQMDFLNPGLLGSQDFFRVEFAGPIDRNGDRESAARLRKLVYPFILRRTKEQVARDLPDKTEMILWCEMGAEQRRIYDSFREHYRESLLDRIAEDGVGKSAIYILEGLTKLRQICDSPAILRQKSQDGADGGPTGAGGGREGADGFPNVSAKLDELIREIEENMGTDEAVVQHKCLVFSQFTSMLGLIRTALDERGIAYLYLDGSVPAEERREAVRQFQEGDGARVFLISLKAGGVGLTLTAADYVYLVDPWWNPAAEQQAIDRSHRIGQAKKVFAYRMICKDSVEEKILQLQEKKRSLAADLVADEAGFVKRLTQEDVAYLFE